MNKFTKWFNKFFQKVSKSLNLPHPVREAGKTLMKIALVLDFLNSLILGKRRKLNSASVESSISTSHYSNTKISTKLDYDFIKIEKSIAETCEIFKNQ